MSMIRNFLLLVVFFTAASAVEVFWFMQEPVLRSIKYGVFVILGIIVYYIVKEKVLRKLFWIGLLVSLLAVSAAPYEEIHHSRNEAILAGLEKDIDAYKEDDTYDRWKQLLAKYDIEPYEIKKKDDFETLRKKVIGRDNTKIKLGTDLAGGFEILYEVLPVKADQEASVDEGTLDIIRDRINNSGLTGNTVQTVGKNRILIQVPGYNRNEVERVKNIIKKRGHLGFRLVSGKNNIRDDFEKIREENAAIRKFNAENPDKHKPLKKYPEGYELLKMTHVKIKDGEEHVSEDELLVETKEALTGDDLANVFPTVDSEGRPAVGMDFTLIGRKKMAKVTGDNIGERLAIVLDGELKSAPNINSMISKSGIIQGDFTQEEVKSMVDILRAGSLDIKMKELSEYSVEASLGDSSIKSGIRSVLYGAIAVVLFMLIYYMKAGAIADATLFFNLVLILGAMSLFQVTLTLPGIAGLLLTIGMAVDANIIIFERIREELAKRTGEDGISREEIGTSIERGYKSAFWTIFDANITTLITALILLLVGTGAIKGFAITLSIGIVGSMFSALVISRALFQLMLGVDAFKKNVAMLSVLSNPSFTFISDRIKGVEGADEKAGQIFPLKWKMQTLSVVLIIASAVFFFVKGDDKYGVDFKGGSITKVAFSSDITADDLRDGLEDEFPNVKVQRFYDPIQGGTENTYSIYLPETGQINNISKRLKTVLDAEPEASADFIYTDELKKALGEKDWVAFRASDGNEMKKLDNPRDKDLFFRTLDEAVIITVDGELGNADKVAEKLNPADFNALAVSTTGDTVTIIGSLRKERERLKDFLVSTYADKLAPEGFKSIKKDETGSSYTMSLILKKEMSDKDITSVLESTAAQQQDIVSAEVLSRDGMNVNLKLGVDGDVGARAVEQTVKDLLPVSSRFLGDNSIGSVVASELQQRGYIAIILALFAIIVYITVRFEFNFSIGAVLALVHDVLITMGAILLADTLGLDVKIDLTILAAVLTIIGYSLNDTIVVFDRIREKFPMREDAHQKSQELPRPRISTLIDQGINETLSRTILTSLTTLVVTLCLFFFGGGAIHGFAFALSIGVIVGTYSSIFIASPCVVLVHWLREKKDRKN